jgi:hypothetical protein
MAANCMPELGREKRGNRKVVKGIIRHQQRLWEIVEKAFFSGQMKTAKFRERGQMVE